MTTPIKPATTLPKTMGILVPALGGFVTVRALTWDQVHALRPDPFDPILYFMRVIEAGTVSPPLSIDRQWAIFNQYDEAPLKRVFDAVHSVSGFKQAMQTVDPIATALGQAYIAARTS